MTNPEVPRPEEVKAKIEELDELRAMWRAQLKVSERVHGKVETIQEVEP